MAKKNRTKRQSHAARKQAHPSKADELFKSAVADPAPLVQVTEQNNHPQKQPQAEPQAEQQKRAEPNRGGPYMNFFFGFGYQVLTVFLLAIALTFFGYFLSKEHWRGLLWSSIGIVCIFLIAFGLYAQQHWPVFQASVQPEPSTAPTSDRLVKPKLTLDAGRSLDSKKPFETRFILTNHGPLPVTFNYHSEAFAFDKPNMPVAVFNAAEETLQPDQQRSLYCDMQPIPPVIAMERAQTIVLQITVTYTYTGLPEGSEESAGFKFFAKRGADGSYVWFPAGQAEGLNPDNMPKIPPSEAGPPTSKADAPTPENRAYIGTHGAEIEKALKAGQTEVIGRVTIINTGATPAHNVMTRNRGILAPDESTADDWEFKPIPGSRPSKTVLMPGSPKFVDFRSQFDEEKVRLIESGVYKFYFFGYVEYDDIGNNHHRTEFCYVYVPGTNSFKYCSTGNAAT